MSEVYSPRRGDLVRTQIGWRTYHGLVLDAEDDGDMILVFLGNAVTVRHRVGALERVPLHDGATKTTNFAAVLREA